MVGYPPPLALEQSEKVGRAGEGCPWGNHALPPFYTFKWLPASGSTADPHAHTPLRFQVLQSEIQSSPRVDTPGVHPCSIGGMHGSCL